MTGSISASATCDRLRHPLLLGQGQRCLVVAAGHLGSTRTSTHLAGCGSRPPGGQPAGAASDSRKRVEDVQKLLRARSERSPIEVARFGARRRISLRRAVGSIADTKLFDFLVRSREVASRWVMALGNLQGKLEAVRRAVAPRREPSPGVGGAIERAIDLDDRESVGVPYSRYSPAAASRAG